jgi:8-oxo-dGTP pyrophosphatase MutT (NUDIX family)
MATRAARIETCAGGVVYRCVKQRIEIAVAVERDRLRGVRNTRLAKGHIETGETLEAAALREVREEIGLPAEIVAPLGSVKYSFLEKQTEITKTVHFFLMRLASEEVHELDGEMQSVYWSPIETAVADLTFDTERRIAERAQQEIASGRSRPNP